MKKYTYNYPRPALTADILIFFLKNNEWHILLIQRNNSPYEGFWALPGGFVDIDEPVKSAAFRELKEETGIENVTLEFLYYFDEPGRDPRGWTITIAFIGFLDFHIQPNAASDARSARWFNINSLPDLAFDHKKIIAMAKEKLKAYKSKF